MDPTTITDVWTRRSEITFNYVVCYRNLNSHQCMRQKGEIQKVWKLAPDYCQWLEAAHNGCLHSGGVV